MRFLVTRAGQRRVLCLDWLGPARDSEPPEPDSVPFDRWTSSSWWAKPKDIWGSGMYCPREGVGSEHFEALRSHAKEVYANSDRGE